MIVSFRPSVFSVAAAKACIEAQKENGTHRGQMIGRMLRDYSELREGDYVIVSHVGRRSYTIERPMSVERIAEERKQGSLLTTYVPTVGVPLNGVKLRREL